MSEYQVTIKQTEVYIINVEAETEKEANDKALELLEGEKFKYHDDSEVSTDAEEIHL